MIDYQPSRLLWDLEHTWIEPRYFYIYLYTNFFQTSKVKYVRKPMATYHKYRMPSKSGCQSWFSQAWKRVWTFRVDCIHLILLRVAYQVGSQWTFFSCASISCSGTLNTIILQTAGLTVNMMTPKDTVIKFLKKFIIQMFMLCILYTFFFLNQMQKRR